MKPQARIQATIEVLEKIENARVPMDVVIGDYMRSRRYIGSKDRAAVAERVYSIMRGKARIGWWLERSGTEDTPRNRVIAHLALIEEANAKRFKDMFDGSQYAPAKLSEEEQKFAASLIDQKLSHSDMPEAVLVECPPEYEEKLREYFADDFVVEMEAMIAPATLDMRVNTFLIERENAKASLEKDGVETDETPFSPWGLRARSKVYLAKTKAFAKGWIEIQDEGSQLISHICKVESGMQVLDYCAGGGGKTLALAAAMKRKGRIVAMDLDEKRLEKGRLRYKKAQLADIVEVRPLSDEKHKKWLKRQKEKFDVVLLDVPCSGSGTWRRNPDLRWNNHGPELSELLSTQAEILERAAKTVKPGGRLIYATCSLLPEENEDQIAAFLERHREFSPVIPNAPAEGSQDNQGDSSHALGMTKENPYLRLTPHRHSTDGFFAASLKRI